MFLEVHCLGLLCNVRAYYHGDRHCRTLGGLYLCIFLMVYLVSAATLVANGEIFTSIVDYTQPNPTRFYYFVFGTLWSNALVQSLASFIIASACCMWYFSHRPGGELHTPVLRSNGRAFIIKIMNCYWVGATPGFV